MSHWGKRPRDKDDETFVRFSDLSQEKKMERRREEREEKKERERTLSYFKSVDRALGDAADVSMLTAIVDGFFVELMKLLKADSTFHLLRNGLICKVIEKALASAPLLHSKSLLYVFIGHLSDIVSSPVASYLLETLMASISQSLSALEEGDFETEMIPDGPGIHTGSGVPSAMTLVGSVTEELGEYAEDLLTHEVASRATRSILLVLGGFTIRGAPALPRQVRFSEPLDQLTQFLVKALETGYQTTYQLETPGEAWYAAAKETAASLVIQSLLRVSEPETKAYELVCERLHSLDYKGQPLLSALLQDSVGCHVFQAYLKAPAAADALAAAHQLSEGSKIAQKAKLLAAIGIESTTDTSVEELVQKAKKCPWYHAFLCVQKCEETLLAPGSELVSMAGYVLHDLALYAPASWYLGELWSKLIAKHLTLLFDYSNVMVNTLIALVYKSGLAGSPGLDDDGSGTGLLSKDIHDAVAADRAKGVLFFQVGIDTQKDICDQLNTFAKSRCPKGLVQYLLIDNGLGDNGVDLLRYLLILAPEASSNLLNSFDKIRLTDLIAILQTKKGSLVIQQLIRSSFFKYSREEEGKGAKKKGDTTVKNTATDRLARRLRESLFSLAADRHATFVVEVLYDTAEVETKELIVKALVPLFEEVRRPTKGFFQRPPPPAEGGNIEEGEGEANPVHTGPSLSAAKKILQKCFVEQYVYRKDEWKKLAQRQSQVHRLLGKMFLE